MESDQSGQPCRVTRKVHPKNDEFEEFTKDFSNYQPWITRDDGGWDADGTLRCMRVLSIDADRAVVVNNEGYCYERYVALEPLGLRKD